MHRKKYNIGCVMSSKNTSTFGPLAIRQQFLNISSYEHTKSHNNKLNLLYDELCDIFISYYSTINQKGTSMKKEGSVNSNSNESQHFRFIQQLQSFNVQFSQIMMEISSFQISCLENLKLSNRPVFDNLNELSVAVRQNKQLQREISEIVKKMEPIFKLLKVNFNNYKKGDENPECYYDQIYSQNYKKDLIEKINDGSILAKQIFQKKQVVQQKISVFDSILMKFKCKLIQNKYSVRKAIFNFTEKMKYSFVEMVQLFKQCTNTHKIEFLKVLEDKSDDILLLQEQLMVENQIEHPIDQSVRWRKAIEKSLSIYLREAQLVEQVIDGLCRIFKKSQEMHEIKKNRFREVIQQICQFYAQIETPRQQMEQLFSISDNLKKKFSIILQRLTYIKNTVIQNRIHTSKHSQIIISLIKMKIKNNQSFFDKRNKKQLEELIKQLSFSQIKTYILSFYQCCIMNQNQLEDTLIGIGRPRRKTLDSMQISHSTVYKKYSVERKKPLAQQLWLWRDFRQQSNPIQKQYLEYFDKVSAYIEQSNDRFKIKNDIELQRYTCSLGKRNIDGQLLLMNNKLEFISKSLRLHIEWKQIISIQQQNNFFNKAIRIVTSQGKILFTNFKADISTIIATLRQIQQKPKNSSETSLTRKKEIVLSLQQIKYIEARKKKILNDLPKLNVFKLIVEQTFQGERIDEIYELIYSDKTFDFYGRQQPCFFSYTGKKGGNFNWVAQKYDKPGPQFYTLQDGITFQNCPLFSHRKITYNHPMKPSAIPFMPKQSKNEDNRYIYWISHEEFIYLIKSTVFQVPFADTFYVEMAHRVSIVEGGVNIQIYSRIVFVKDTSFKSAILKNTDPEIDENMIGFMGQIRKLLKLRKQAAKGAKIPLQEHLPVLADTLTQKAGSEVQKLKLYNKILIGILLFFIFTNILHYF